MTNQQKWDAAIALVRGFVPGIKVVKKSESKLHKAIGWLLGKVGNDNYLHGFYTTIGYTIATPTVLDGGFDYRAWTVACHEGRHALQASKLTRVLFSLAYLFPLVLTPIGLILGVATGSWWWLLSLAFLAPIPSPFRAYAELQAYKTSIVAMWSSGIDVSRTNYIESVVDNFVGPNYYWMWPFRNMVRTELYAWCESLRSNEAILDEYDEAVASLGASLK